MDRNAGLIEEVFAVISNVMGFSIVVVVLVVVEACITDTVRLVQITLNANSESMRQILEPLWVVVQDSSHCSSQQSVDRRGLWDDLHHKNDEESIRDLEVEFETMIRSEFDDDSVTESWDIQSVGHDIQLQHDLQGLLLKLASCDPFREDAEVFYCHIADVDDSRFGLQEAALKRLLEEGRYRTDHVLEEMECIELGMFVDLDEHIIFAVLTVIRIVSQRYAEVRRDLPSHSKCG